MDADHFDVLTRTLTKPLSRRVALGGLTIGGMLALSPALDQHTGLTRKGKRKRRKSRTVTRTFTNSDSITTSSTGPTNSYPSLIEVSGFPNGRILDVNLTLHRINHTDPEDLKVLLAAAHLPGLNALVMRSVGDDDDAVDLTLTLDDQAAQPIPSDTGVLTSGTFQPTNARSQLPVFPPPAPPLSGRSALAVFTNADPNGTWQLFVTGGGDSDIVTGGWSLQITAKVRKKRKKKR